MPVNLQGSEAYSMADYSVDIVIDAIVGDCFKVCVNLLDDVE